MYRHWRPISKKRRAAANRETERILQPPVRHRLRRRRSRYRQRLQLIGDDSLAFFTDYPHSDSDFPEATQEFFHQEMPAASRRKILWDDCAKFYGIEG